MKVGLVRRLDNLGRIVIPKEYRKTLHIDSNELLEVFFEDKTIIIKKHNVFKNVDIFIKAYIKSLKKVYGINVLVTDLKEIKYSNVAEFKNKSIEELKNNYQTTEYDINPNGDLLGKIIFIDINNVLYEKLIQLTINVFNDLLE